MRLKLRNEINPNYSTIDQILTNRGIPYSDISRYIHTSDDEINDFRLFGQVNLNHAAGALIQTIQHNKDCMVIVDCDCDGYTSSAILINYLYELFPAWVLNHLEYYVHDSKQHGLSDCLDYILNNPKRPFLVICPDSSSNDYREHQELYNNNITVIVLDHHEAPRVSEYAITINNQLSNYPNKFLSGAGVTWQFCRYLDSILNLQNANHYRDLVALGLDGDMMSLLNYETKHLINDGLRQPHNPFIVYMAEKNEFSLKGKLTPIGVAFYIVPFVNAMTRSGTIDEKRLLFDSMLSFKAFTEVPSTKRGHTFGETEKLVEQAVRVATNVKNRQTKAQDNSLEKIENKIRDEKLLDHKVILLLMKFGEIDRNIAGLIANKIMAKYQRPVCILTGISKIEDGVDLPPWDEYWKTRQSEVKYTYQGSARGCDLVGIEDFKKICTDTGCCEYAEGHPNAFGLGIDEENIDEFIRLTDIALKDINTEPVYFVDYIYKNGNVNSQNILDIAHMEYFWGKDVDEALVAVEGLKVNPAMVTVYTKERSGNTLKIQLPNGVSLMKFRATDQECLKLQNDSYELDIVGTCNQNEWNGNITAQIFIQDYQIVDSSDKYYF